MVPSVASVLPFISFIGGVGFEDDGFHAGLTIAENTLALPPPPAVHASASHAETAASDPAAAHATPWCVDALDGADEISIAVPVGGVTGAVLDALLKFPRDNPAMARKFPDPHGEFTLPASKVPWNWTADHAIGSVACAPVIRRQQRAQVREMLRPKLNDPRSPESAIFQNAFWDVPIPINDAQPLGGVHVALDDPPWAEKTISTFPTAVPVGLVMLCDVAAAVDSYREVAAISKTAPPPLAFRCNIPFNKLGYILITGLRQR